MAQQVRASGASYSVQNTNGVQTNPTRPIWTALALLLAGAALIVLHSRLHARPKAASEVAE